MGRWKELHRKERRFLERMECHLQLIKCILDKHFFSAGLIPIAPVDSESSNQTWIVSNFSKSFYYMLTNI